MCTTPGPSMTYPQPHGFQPRTSHPYGLQILFVCLFMGWMYIIILCTVSWNCQMNEVFKQFLILCGKGRLPFSLIWLMTLFAPTHIEIFCHLVSSAGWR